MAMFDEIVENTGQEKIRRGLGTMKRGFTEATEAEWVSIKLKERKAEYKLYRNPASPPR